MLILFGEGIQHGHQPRPTLIVGELLLGIELRVEHQSGGIDIRLGTTTFPVLPGASLQRQVVRDPKEPSLEVRSGAVLSQMLEQRQKDVLNQIFAINDRQPERADVPEQRIPELVEERQHLVFDPGAIRGGR